MTKKKAPSVIDELLAGTATHAPQSVILDNLPLCAAILEFLLRKADSDPKCAHLTLSWFYMNSLRDHFRGPRCMHTVRKYVREILKLDPSTGKPL